MLSVSVAHIDRVAMVAPSDNGGLSVCWLTVYKQTMSDGYEFFWLSAWGENTPTPRNWIWI